MKLFYYLPFLVSFILLSSAAQAQIYPGQYTLSVENFTFEPGDSLRRPGITIDTSGMGIWQIGTTVKPYFASPDTPSSSIMTLRSGAYPVNINNGFVVKMQSTAFNPIFSFVHKFETDSGKDGGIVEFSADNGLTWENMLGQCNNDGLGPQRGILTSGFYRKTDTLYTGEPGFSGNSNGWKKSSFQFFWGLPVKGTTGCLLTNSMYIRFRFISDSLANNMDGWLIDSIQFRKDYYSGVKNTERASLKVFPNPSHNGVFYFPQLTDGYKYNIEIRNVLGQVVARKPYHTELNLSGYRNGTYFYLVTNGAQAYSGKLLLE